jgi:hypothetical protein
VLVFPSVIGPLEAVGEYANDTMKPKSSNFGAILWKSGSGKHKVNLPNIELRYQ